MSLRIIARAILAWGIALAILCGAGLYDSLRSYSDMVGALGREATPPWGVAPSLAIAALLATLISGVSLAVAVTIASIESEKS